MKKDFFYKLITNVIRIPITFLLQSIFPRILNPSQYGNYEFLTKIASTIILFFDTGTSTAFYTMLSKNNQDKLLIRFYWLLTIALTFLYFGAATGFIFFKIANILWIAQSNWLIYLSLIWGVFTFYNAILLKYTDAVRLTKIGEIIRSAHLIISVLSFLLIIYFFGKINLRIFFLIQIVLQFVLIWGFKIVLNSGGFKVIPNVKLYKRDFFLYSNKIWNYSHPLILYSFIILLGGLGQRWILQEYGGSIQQGYFGISFKLGAFVFIIAGAIMPLLMREFSVYHENNDINNIKRLFLTNSRLLYFIASVLGIFVSIHSNFILSIYAGKEYLAAQSTVSIMAFYPIHQTLGQVNGTLFYSTNRTKQLKNIGIIFVPISLLISYVLIAHNGFLGLGFGLGAKGLAYQMIFVQFFSANASLYLNSLYLRLNFWKLFIHQVVSLSSLAIIGYALNYIISNIFVNLYFEIIIEFLLFLIFSLSIGYLFPYLLGLSRDKINSVLLSFKGIIASLFTK